MQTEAKMSCWKVFIGKDYSSPFLIKDLAFLERLHHRPTFMSEYFAEKCKVKAFFIKPKKLCDAQSHKISRSCMIYEQHVLDMTLSYYHNKFNLNICKIQWDSVIYVLLWKLHPITTHLNLSGGAWDILLNRQTGLTNYNASVLNQGFSNILGSKDVQ